MADSVDWGQVESQLKSKAGQYYDPSMLGDVQRNASYGQENNQGSQSSVDDWVNRVSNKAQLRGSNESNSTYVANGQGGVTVGPTGKVNDPNGTGLPQQSQTNTNPSSGGQGGSGTSPMQDPQWQALYDQLMSRAQQSTTIDQNDPNIRQQTDAYNANATRQMRDYISGVAEGASPYANLTGEKRMANEKVAQDTGNLRSTLIGNEITARRTEIQNALSQMGGMLTASQQLALQKELGLLDANLRQQGINSGNDQFSATLGLNSTNQANYWDSLRSGLITG